MSVCPVSPVKYAAFPIIDTEFGRTVVTVVPKNETLIAGDDLPNVVAVADDIITYNKFEQFKKALEPILVTELGIVIDGRLVHPLNALSLIVVTELGIVIDIKLEQLINALEPILVTEFGIIIDGKLEHPLNALEPILVSEFGIVIDIKLEQPLNALEPILVIKFEVVVTVLTIVTVVICVLFRKAFIPIIE